MHPIVFCCTGGEADVSERQISQKLILDYFALHNLPVPVFSARAVWKKVNLVV